MEGTRESLGRASDLTTCRTALQQVNVHLGRNPERKPAGLTADQRQLLQDASHFGLSAADLAEVESGSFTALDGQHLEMSLLFRDAARSLDLDGLPPSEQATRAFAWVVRQVRLREPRPGEPVPAHFVLRRGSGSALERGLVFLALLDQLDIPGCLLGPAPEGPTAINAWGCGALVARSDGGKQVLVFDPRLGLPLPASLAELRKQPELLKPFTVDPKHPYDLTAEQLQSVQVFPAGFLSQLAPRMSYLQGELSGSEGRVRLGLDPVKQQAIWKEAAGGVEVRLGKAAVRSLRQFLPEAEGGVDTSGQRLALFRSEMVPWKSLPPLALKLPGIAGDNLRNTFGAPFVALQMDPGRPRDQMLRGQHGEAVQVLVRGRDELETQRQLLRVAPDLDAKLEEWARKAIEAHSQLIQAQAAAVKDRSLQREVEEARARVDAVYREGEKPLMLMLNGSGASIRSSDALFLLTLCRHEQAERLDTRLAKARKQGRTISPREQADALRAWQEASARWEMVLNEETETYTGPARRMWARVLQALGEPGKAAMQLEDLSGNLTPLEKTARLYLASQLEKK